MKLTKTLALFLALTSVVACSSSEQTTGTADNANKTTAQTQTAQATAGSVDGKYVFDATVWLDEMKKADPNFAQAPQELVQKMTEGFSKFNIEIKGADATANFGEMVVAGKIEEVSKAADHILYKMTPTDADKKDQPIMLKIAGSTLTAGPDGQAKQQLFFKKM